MTKKIGFIDILLPVCIAVVSLDIFQLASFVLFGNASLGSRIIEWGITGWAPPYELLAGRIFKDVATLVVIVGYIFRNKNDDFDMTGVIVVLLSLGSIIYLIPQILLGVGRLSP